MGTTAAPKQTAPEGAQGQPQGDETQPGVNREIDGDIGVASPVGHPLERIKQLVAAEPVSQAGGQEQHPGQQVQMALLRSRKPCKPSLA